MTAILLDIGFFALGFGRATLPPYVLGHRFWLAAHAASRKIRVETVIDEIIDQGPIP